MQKFEKNAGRSDSDFALFIKDETKVKVHPENNKPLFWRKLWSLRCNIKLLFLCTCTLLLLLFAYYMQDYIFLPVLLSKQSGLVTSRDVGSLVTLEGGHSLKNHICFSLFLIKEHFGGPIHIRRFQEYFNHINIFISSTTLQFLQYWYQNGVNYLFLIEKSIEVTSGFISKVMKKFLGGATVELFDI